MRAVAAERRDGLEADVRSAAARRIADEGLGFAHLAGHETVSAYHPIGAELDCLPLMARLAKAGHATALPVIAKRGERLIFRRWAPGEPLADGRAGIPIPPEDAPVVEPEVLLVPLLAFDREGYRLGYGGGYYDRTLTALRRQGPILAIGLAFAVQEIPAGPRLDYDARLDWVLTEEGPIVIEGMSDAPALRR
ncbi:MAG: 5-formyltetrahydrofolate cyclo-ligase [Hyphomicrobiales bacterium]|nr:5-formyltetrahydrofolate cyclo-ligase [Hyphomicrobiales bacterium]